MAAPDEVVYLADDVYLNSASVDIVICDIPAVAELFVKRSACLKYCRYGPN